MSIRKKIVVFTGAGISAESGLKTFRGADGLWEGYRLEDVATPEAWERDPATVQRFYNLRRKLCREAYPNAAHRALTDLEKKFDVQIITQNIDDLHERAGSSNVLHLHGEIVKSQSSSRPDLVYAVEGDEIGMGETCALGSQLRPHVVWFGEAVPNMHKASKLTAEADLFIVIGTSLQVYPAANLLYETKAGCQVILIDPNAKKYSVPSNTICIEGKASVEVPKLVNSITE